MGIEPARVPGDQRAPAPGPGRRRPARCWKPSAGLPQCLEALRPGLAQGRARAADGHNRGRFVERARGRHRLHVVTAIGNTSMSKPVLDAHPRSIADWRSRHASTAAPSTSARGSNTIMIQIGRRRAGRCRAGSIRLVAGDTDLTLDAGQDLGPRVRPSSSGNAAKLAGEELRRQILPAGPTAGGGLPASRSAPAAASPSRTAVHGARDRPSPRCPEDGASTGIGPPSIRRRPRSTPTAQGVPYAHLRLSPRRSPRSASIASSAPSRSARITAAHDVGARHQPLAGRGPRSMAGIAQGPSGLP